jgi:hypothetical protein
MALHLEGDRETVADVDHPGVLTHTDEQRTCAGRGGLRCLLAELA